MQPFNIFGQQDLQCSVLLGHSLHLQLGDGNAAEGMLFFALQDVAKDVTSQEIIAKEVTTFMQNIGSVRVRAMLAIDKTCCHRQHA